MRVLIVTIVLALLFGIPAGAEIEKLAVQCNTGFCFYWWPKLPPIDGWHQDREQSLNYGMNTLAPDGSSFRDAEAVMYANAVYKLRIPETTSLDIFIEDDRAQFLSADPHIVVSEVAPLKTGDALQLRSFTFTPKVKGNWEQVSYGEEGDFYITFVLSSRSKEGFVNNQDQYRSLVERYKVKGL